MNSPASPVHLNSVGLYAKLVEGSGSYEIKVRLVNLRDESPVMEIKATAQWPNPEEPFELAFNFQGIPLGEFGTYEFQLYADKIFLGRALLRAVKFELPPLGPIKG